MTQFTDPRDAHLARLTTQVQELNKLVVDLSEQQDSFDRYVALAQILRFTVGFGWVSFIIKSLKK